MAKNSRRRRQPQLSSSASNTHPPRGRQPPRAPQDEQTSSEGGWLDASITEDGIALDVVIAEKIAAAMAKLPKDRIDPEVIRQLVNETLSASPKSEMTTPRGPRPTDDWYWVAIGEAYSYEKATGHLAGTGKISELCAANTNTGYSPDPDQITRLFKRNFFGHKIGKDPKPASRGRVSRR